MHLQREIEELNDDDFHTLQVKFMLQTLEDEESDKSTDEESEEEDISIQTIPTNIDEYSETDF